MSFFKRIKNKLTGKNQEFLKGFSKTNADFKDKFSQLRDSYTGINDDFLEELMVILLESDMGFTTAEKITETLRKMVSEYYNVQFDNVIDFLFEIMHDVYGEDDFKINYNTEGPTVIMIVGVNGSGKTTTIGKLINYFQKQNKKVATAAGDTFRAGASEQLNIWSKKFNVPCIMGADKADPSSVLVDACRYAKEHQIDILLCDTAGRLHNKSQLMNELTKMHKVLGREIVGAPANVWLVIDGNTGQNGLAQAEVFLEATQVDGIILTKMDGTAKGGVVIGIKDKYDLPVGFVGLGEGIDDLQEFNLDAFFNGITEGVYAVNEE